MNDGHILVTILAAFIVMQTIAIGLYRYLRAVADRKTVEADMLARETDAKYPVP